MYETDSLFLCASDFLQVPGTDLQSEKQQPPASISVNWEEPNTTSHPTDGQNDQMMDVEVDVDEVDGTKERDLTVPLKILKVNKLFKCPICSTGFSSKKTMEQHVKRHPEDKISYQCQFCDRNFCHKSEFIIHTRIHDSSRPYQCQDCDRSFEQRDSLFIHRQTHAEEKPYPCFSKKMESESQLRSATPVIKMEEETQGESDIRTFPLTITPYDKSEFDQESLQPLCLYQIQDVTDIDRDSSAALRLDHIKTEPAESIGRVPNTNSDNQLLPMGNPGEQHGAVMAPERLRVTSILPRRVLGRTTKLVVQFEAGTAKKPYKCPFCTKCFCSTKTLIRHARLHSEDKPYLCQFCGRNFCQKSDLVNHTRIHTGEKPYQCQECKKSFAQKGNLVVHMRKHSRVKTSRL